MSGEPGSSSAAAAAPTAIAATPPRLRRISHWHGVGYLVVACACMALLDTLAKYSSGFAPLEQRLWLRYAVQLVLMTAWWAVLLRPTVGWRFFRTQHPRFHLARALLLLVCTGVVFVGLRFMPLGEFTAVAFLGPMVSMVFSGWLLKEPMERVHWIFAASAFAGALIVIRPGAGIFGWAVVLPLLVAVLNASFQLLTRRLANADEHPVFSQWVAGAVGTVLLTVPLLWPGAWRWDLAADEWAALVAMGAAGTLGHLFFMKAFAHDTAPALAPYSYIQIVFAMFGGWLVFGHAPDGWALVGMLVIAASGVASGLLRAHRSAGAMARRLP